MIIFIFNERGWTECPVKDIERSASGFMRLLPSVSQHHGGSVFTSHSITLQQVHLMAETLQLRQSTRLWELLPQWVHSLQHYCDFQLPQPVPSSILLQLQNSSTKVLMISRDYPRHSVITIHSWGSKLNVQHSHK